MVRLNVGPANAGVDAVRVVCGLASLSAVVIRKRPTVAMAKQMSRDVTWRLLLGLFIARFPSSLMPLRPTAIPVRRDN